MEKILTEIIRKKHQVVAWNQVADQLMKADVVMESFVMSRRNEVHFSIPGESLEQVKEMLSGSGKINFFIPFKGLIFTSEIKSFAGNRLVTQLPEDSEFQDRRTDLRIDTVDIRIEFEINNNRFSKNCFNLSSGGFSVMFMNSENIGKLNDLTEIEIKLKYKEEVIKLKSRVASVVNVKAYEHEAIPFAGKRVSFEFKDVNPEMKMHLNSIIVANK